MKRDIAIINISKRNDTFGTHELSSSLFAQEYTSRGYKPVKINIDDSEQAQRSIELYKSNRVAFAHCEQGHGIALSIINPGKGPQNIFELYGIPAFSHLRDYPFCPWVQQQITNASPTSTIFHIDEKSPQLSRAMGAKASQKFLPHAYIDWKHDKKNIHPPTKKLTPFQLAGTKTLLISETPSSHHTLNRPTCSMPALKTASMTALRPYGKP